MEMVTTVLQAVHKNEQEEELQTVTRVQRTHTRTYLH